MKTRIISLLSLELTVCLDFLIDKIQQIRYGKIHHVYHLFYSYLTMYLVDSHNELE